MGGKNFREFEVLMQRVAEAAAETRDMGKINELLMSAADPVTSDFQSQVSWLKGRLGDTALSIRMGGDEITILVDDYRKITPELLLEIKDQIGGRVYGTSGIEGVKERSHFNDRIKVTSTERTGQSKLFFTEIAPNWLAWAKMQLLMEEGINSLKQREAAGRKGIVLIENKEGVPQEFSSKNSLVSGEDLKRNSAQLAQSQSSPGSRAMTNTAGRKNIFNISELLGKGYTDYKTSSGEFLFILRQEDRQGDQSRSYLLNVFDKNYPQEMSIAQLYFSFSSKYQMAILNSNDKSGFKGSFTKESLLLSVLEGNGFRSLDWDKYWRSQPSEGFWIKEGYRNKRDRRVWNLDRLLMATALTIVSKQGAELFWIKSINRRMNYYHDKFGAKGDSDALRIDLNELKHNPLFDHVKEVENGNGEHIFEVPDGPDQVSQAMITPNGGIDLTSANMNVQVKTGSPTKAFGDDNGNGIQFHLSPAMLEQLRNAPGFVPVIISIQPMTDLRRFLGIQENSPATAATV
jgi:hypothetical protein